MASRNTIESQIQILEDISALDNIINRVDNLIRSMERLDNITIEAFGRFSDIPDVCLPAMPEIPEQQNPISESVPNVPIPEPEIVPIEWNIPNDVDVFDTTGIERYNQEMTALDNQMEQLMNNQTHIDSLADNMDIIPDNMINDINIVNQRILSLQNSIQSIERDGIDDIGANRVNNQIERLREQLNAAIQRQTALNEAIGDMDASLAQREYQRLNGIISNAERNIRDNINSQNQFNETVRNGESAASGLIAKLKAAIGIYAGFQTLGKVIDLSDKMTQSTARLNMIVDDGGSVDNLKDRIFAVAQDSRADYMQTMDLVGKLGLQAGNAFKSNDELLSFADQLNKQFAIAGTDAQGIEAATLQLTQALGSGALRGEEFNSVFEQAPNIMQTIADYIGKDIGELKDLASEGALTADIVKNALFNSAEETNKKFAEMPMTFSQLTTSFKNRIIQMFQPILQSINNLINNESFQKFIDGLIVGIGIIVELISGLIEIIGEIGGLIYDNWSLIEPVIWGIIAALTIWYGRLVLLTIATWAQNAAETIAKGIKMLAVPVYALLTGATMAETAAQWGLNSALYACPLVWILLLIISIIAAIYLVVAAINKLTGSSKSATGIICGCFTTMAAFIWNRIVALVNFIIDIFVVLWNFIAAFANFFGNVFNDPAGSIARLFFDLVDSILELLQSLANAIDSIFGSELASGVQGWRNKLGGWVDDKFGKGEEIMAKITGDEYKLDRWSYEDAWNTGYEFGESVDDFISDGLDKLFDGIDDKKGIDGNKEITVPPASIPDIDKVGKVDKVGGTVDIASEDLKYLRDAFENDVVQEVYSSTIVPQVTITFGDIKETADVDNIMTTIRERVKEQLSINADGIHA